MLFLYITAIGELTGQLHQKLHFGKHDQARELFGRLMLIINTDQQIPGTRPYIMKKRGVFKTTVSRQKPVELSREAIAEIEFNFDALKPYLRA